MRPVRYDDEVGGGIGNQMEKRSLGLEHAKEAWDEWEIHCLILLSLSLQAFLSLTADLRRRSASRVLSNILWLAYVSADTVAVFVLGHLAVHAQGPSHELMLFWAPFVLVHLGGQDSISAFSKQDNELWTRHLLGLVTQTAVAGYVVSKSSWLDTRLRAAMVLMFLCGFLKYSGRTYCLYSASPKSLRDSSMGSLSDRVSFLQDAQAYFASPKSLRHSSMGSLSDRVSFLLDAQAKFGDILSQFVEERFEAMFHADKFRKFIKYQQTHPMVFVDDIMFMDAPVDDWGIIMIAEKLPDLLKQKDMPDRCIAYHYVAKSLVQSYRSLYTKAPLERILDYGVEINPYGNFFWILLRILFMLTYTLFQCISTAIALVLFVSAEKEGHHSKADVTVSYILLVGAIVLDLLPALTSIVSHARKTFRPVTEDECADISFYRCIQPLGWRTRKQWSEELAQYRLTRRYTSVQCYHGCMPSIQKWILKHKPLGDWCVEYLDLTRTPATDDLRLFVLDRLLLLQTRREEWDFASFRGDRALRKWMGKSRHQVQEPAESRSGYDALHKSLSTRVEFPASVLIWHIATEICYFSEDNGHDIENDETRTTTKRKKRSRELSQYIMYLVFKCDVMLTSKSRLMHKKTHEELTKYFQHAHLDEKQTVIVMFEAMKKQALEEEAKKKQEQLQGSTQEVAEGRKTNEVPANTDAAATSIESGRQDRLWRMVEALYSPVLPLACDVAKELIKINDEAHLWELISEVWLEMLFYTAPRCRAAFHYEHLSTGGEFITHVLFLMRSLGPFMPKAAGA